MTTKAARDKWRAANGSREREVGAAYQRRRRAENPEKFRAILADWHKKNPHKKRCYEYRARYGITLDQYTALLEAQHGVCAVCHRPEESLNQNGQLKPLAVDHDHATQTVRGLLCSGCNISIGHAKEDPTVLRGLAAYLERHSGCTRLKRSPQQD